MDFCFIDAYKIARKYIHKADGRGGVDVVKVSRDVKKIWPRKSIHLYWLCAVSED